MTTPSHDAPETRSIPLDVEVPGTLEQVWEAIATGPGIAAWFGPAEVAEGQGGAVRFDMGSGMEEAGTVVAWDPPRRFAYEERWQPFEDAPAARLATEFLVESRSAGTCVVRLVSGVSASGAGWEAELENMREGWRVYLDNLRLYLTHFAGQRCSWIMVTGSAPGPLDRAWGALTGALGLRDAAKGTRAATSPGAPVLAGVVERVAHAEHGRGLTLRIDEPAPGIAIVFVYAWRNQVYANLHVYLFGDEAATTAARDEPAWRFWMDQHFPATQAAPSETDVVSD